MVPRSRASDGVLAGKAPAPAGRSDRRGGEYRFWFVGCARSYFPGAARLLALGDVGGRGACPLELVHRVVCSGIGALETNPGRANRQNIPRHVLGRLPRAEPLDSLLRGRSAGLAVWLVLVEPQHALGPGGGHAGRT